MKKSQFQIKPSNGKDGKNVEIIISEEFSIHNITEVKEDLDKTVSKYKEFTVRVEKIENFDLAALQILIAFKKSLQNAGKKVTISLELPDNLDLIITHSGIKEHLNQ
jgi:anti-anti-sigma regulatory factor